MKPTYFVVTKPTPVLNTPHFREVFSGALPFDDQLLVREVEMIALRGMIFQVIAEKGEHILEVSSAHYTGSQLFIDKRFGQLHHKPPPVVEPKLPPVNVILERMKRSLGLPYVWGGNYGEGIPEWKTYYPPTKPLSDLEEIHYCFYGLDCSGLLYEATDGFVPRNTSEQVKMGEKVSMDDLKPLDLFFYPGHVFILLNETEVIESMLEFGGVTITPLKERLKDLETFTIKRFHPQTIASQKS